MRVIKFQFFSLFFQLSVSNATQVTVRNVGFSLSGNFTCEVSADAPTFYTGIATNVLKVVGKYITFIYNKKKDINKEFRLSINYLHI